MPIYEVETPDGKVVEIEGPEGAAESQVIAEAQRLYSAARPAVDTAVSAVRSAGDSIRAWGNALRGRPEGFEHAGGLPDFGIRLKLRSMDTDEERMSYLEDLAGPGQVVRDPMGRLALTPAGMRAAGFPVETDKPTLIDEHGLSRFDLADLAGDAGEFVGGVAAGTMASPYGLLRGLAAAGLGAFLGKGAQEGAEQLAGWNQQPAGEVGMDMVGAGARGVLGEGLARFGTVIGRGLLAPGASPIDHWLMRKPTVEPERLARVRDLQEIGGQASITQTTGNPVLGRLDELSQMFLKHPRQRFNAVALQNEVKRLEDFYGPRADPIEVGAAVKNAIHSQRKQFATEASERMAFIDSMTGGQRVIPTGNFKQKIASLLDEMPRRGYIDADGVEQLGGPIGVPQGTVDEIRKLADVREGLTLKEWQRLRTDVREGIETGMLMPGVGSRDRRQILTALDEMLDDAVKGGTMPQAVRGALKDFRADYRAQAGQFEANMIERLARDERFAGAIEPEDVVRFIVRPERPSVSRIRRVMNLLPPETAEKVRGAAIRDLLEQATRTDPNNVTSQVFAGAKFGELIEKQWGKETLDATFGEKVSSELMRFARAQTLAAEKHPMIGGLAVANIALHPWANLPKSLQLTLMEKALLNPTFMRYMTEGAQAKTLRAAGDAIGRLSSMAVTMMNGDVD